MPCPHCPHCISIERAKNGCQALVPDSTYRGAGRCSKTANKATGLCGHHEKHPPKAQVVR